MIHKYVYIPLILRIYPLNDLKSLSLRGSATPLKGSLKGLLKCLLKCATPCRKLKNHLRSGLVLNRGAWKPHSQDNSQGFELSHGYEQFKKFWRRWANLRPKGATVFPSPEASLPFPCNRNSPKRLISEHSELLMAAGLLRSTRRTVAKSSRSSRHWFSELLEDQGALKRQGADLNENPLNFEFKRG